jgi:hypothetical protein
LAAHTPVVGKFATLFCVGNLILGWQPRPALATPKKLLQLLAAPARSTSTLTVFTSMVMLVRPQMDGGERGDTADVGERGGAAANATTIQ